MSMVVVSYVVILIFLVGTLHKIWLFATTPSPLKIPLTPAPTSGLGVGRRLGEEVFFFKSLFKSNKWIWFGGYIFHMLLFFVLARHLRYFFDPVPELILMVQQIGMYSGIALSFPVVFLMIRRFAVDRVRYISAFSDFFVLLLFIAIAASGVWLKFFDRVNIVDVKAFIIGLFAFSPRAFPDGVAFFVHFSLILALLVYFPFSKLIHAVGIFFSPSLAQIDNPREKRHSIDE